MPCLYIVEMANDGSYSAYVPDLLGCTTCGDTVAEVKAGIKDAVDLHVEEHRTEGQTVPKPTSAAHMVEAA